MEDVKNLRSKYGPVYEVRNLRRNKYGTAHMCDTCIKLPTRFES